MTETVLPFIGGEHPFSPDDFSAIEMATILMDAENEIKKKETFSGIYKTYLPLWVISIDGQNCIMVEALMLNSDYFRMRRFDKALELQPDRDLAPAPLDDFISKLRHFESRINAFQKEAKIELNGYLDPTIASEVRLLFDNLEQINVHHFMIMAKRLSKESAELMIAPIISAFHADVQKILRDFYQIPLIVNTHLQELFHQFDTVTGNYIQKVRELSEKANSVKIDDTYKTQNAIVNNLTNELTSFKDAKDRSIKSIHQKWDEIRQLNEKIQGGYLELLAHVFKTKYQILELTAPFTGARRGEAISVLMPIYLAIFKEKKNRVAYFPPLILNFSKKKELSRPKGLQTFKNQLDHNFSKQLPPGISEMEDQNKLFKPNTQQLFNDGVHLLRETNIIDSKTYVRIMDAYNEFFRKASGPPKTQL